jgi:ribosomal protein S27E
LRQQSTTISGSYTIIDDEDEEGEEDEANQRRPLTKVQERAEKKLTPHAPSSNIVPNIQHMGKGSNDLGQQLQQPQQQKWAKEYTAPNGENEVTAQIPLAFLSGTKKSRGGKGRGEEEETALESSMVKLACEGCGTSIIVFDHSPLKCLSDSSSASSIVPMGIPSFCISRPLAALGIILFAILATCQLFQFIQHIRRQMRKQQQREDAATGAMEEIINLPDPHQHPSMGQRPVQFSSFNGTNSFPAEDGNGKF